MRPGLIVAVVVAVLAVGLLAVTFVAGSRARGAPLAGNVIVRCRRGHLFTTLWIPGASLTAIRLGRTRYQRCPVGRHWSIVTPVREGDLSPDERSQAGQTHDTPLP